MARTWHDFALARRRGRHDLGILRTRARHRSAGGRGARGLLPATWMRRLSAAAAVLVAAVLGSVAVSSPALAQTGCTTAALISAITAANSTNGTVTLKGPVRSDDEKRAIEAKANEVAGKDKVINELTVVPNQK